MVDLAGSLSVSVGIIAFGAWSVVSMIAANSPVAWMLIGLLPVIVGLVSLCGTIFDAKTATR